MRMSIYSIASGVNAIVSCGVVSCRSLAGRLKLREEGDRNMAPFHVVSNTLPVTIVAWDLGL
jgi:hypothetical protein